MPSERPRANLAAFASSLEPLIQQHEEEIEAGHPQYRGAMLLDIRDRVGEAESFPVISTYISVWRSARS